MSRFNCVRHSLNTLNYLYIVIAIVIILVAGYAKEASIITSPSLIGLFFAVGIFLLLVSLLGLYGASKQHQAVLFFYMIIMMTVFVFQFVVAVACLSSSDENSLSRLIESGWSSSRNQTIWDAEVNFNCCGLKSVVDMPYNCEKLDCYPSGCQPCMKQILSRMMENMQLIGVISLIFNFTELIGIYLTYRFRNIRNPGLNPTELFSE